VSDAPSAWPAYQEAAQQLDKVRRAAAAEAARHAEAVRAAREELTLVRAQLSASHARLRAAGVSPADLLPSEGDVTAAEKHLARGPGGVLGTLHLARSTLEASEAALAGRLPRRPVRLSRVGRRNLLGYAPAALAALAGQIALYAIVGAAPATLVAGLLIPVAAVGLGWLTVSLVFSPGASARVDRTPLLGVVVCTVPALLALVVAVVVGRP
jgi:hypothetical protein